MSLYESSVHPSYNPDRLSRALNELDDIVSTHKLTLRDASDPLATKFRAGSVPMIPETASYGRGIQKRCSCLPPDTPGNPRAVQATALPWDPAWTADEIEAEECRRLCWNALAIISIYNTLCVCHGNEPVNFWLADPGNVSVAAVVSKLIDELALVCPVIPGGSERSRFFNLVHRVFPVIVAERVRLGVVLQEHASLQFLHAPRLGQPWDRGQVGVHG